MPPMPEVETAHVASLHPCALVPQALARIAFGGVCRQALDVPPWGCTICQARLDDLTAMDGGPIPHDAHAARDLAPQMR